MKSLTFFFAACALCIFHILAAMLAMESKGQIIFERMVTAQHPKIVSAEHPVLHAVLHIGPHKTGTTTIQEISRQLVGTIVQDGYDMPWNHMDDKTHLRLI